MLSSRALARATSRRRRRAEAMGLRVVLMLVETFGGLGPALVEELRKASPVRDSFCPCSQNPTVPRARKRQGWVGHVRMRTTRTVNVAKEDTDTDLLKEANDRDWPTDYKMEACAESKNQDLDNQCPATGISGQRLSMPGWRRGALPGGAAAAAGGAAGLTFSRKRLPVFLETCDACLNLPSTLI